MRAWFVRRDFWVFGVIVVVGLAIFDAIYFPGSSPLVAATLLLGEATALLAVASFYSGHQQRQTNAHLEGIVARWLEIETLAEVGTQAASSAVEAPANRPESQVRPPSS